MGRTFKERPTFKKTKKPSKKGAFWGEGKLRVKKEALIRGEDEK